MGRSRRAPAFPPLPPFPRAAKTSVEAEFASGSFKVDKLGVGSDKKIVGEFKAELLKGRGNYLCPTRLQRAFHDTPDLFTSTEVADMKLIIDWVPNHTAWDHPWTRQHKDWYKLNDKGEIFPVTFLEGAEPEYWTDVVGLNYQDPGLWMAMTDAMAFWLKEADIDGFRCDVAFVHGFVRKLFGRAFAFDGALRRITLQARAAEGQQLLGFREGSACVGPLVGGAGGEGIADGA